MMQEHGELTVGGITRPTLQCAHCGRIWVPIKGSGIRRGYCHKCNQVTCGNNACDHCTPVEKKLDIQDGTASHTATKHPVLWLPK